jgi:hypothetical protein
LYGNNSHFILNISIMARFKLVGKKRTKKMAPAKQGQDNMRSSHQVVAGSAGASSGAAAGAASPVTAPANDTFVPLAGSLGTKLHLAFPSPLLLLQPPLLVLPPPHQWLVPICLILPPSLALQLPVSLCPRRVHQGLKNLQKDPFHLLLKPQPSPLPLPLLLSTLVTLHPSLLTLLLLR